MRCKLECDVCPLPATVIRPATRNRDRALYCDDCAGRFLGWPDVFHRIGELSSEDLKLMLDRPDYGGRFP